MQGRQELEDAIAALEAQRGLLGDAVVDTSIASLRAQLDTLTAAPPSKERRQATVLFADVSGFTAMSERMDMEDVADAMAALWERLDAAVLEHGGTIDKHIGDALMAIWGVGEAREDDAERAIHCALAMQAHVEEFADEVARFAPDAPPPRLRVGINTGPVVLGEVGSRSEFTAMGDTVNTASRIETAAEPGEVLISRDTYRHVRGIFHVSARSAVTVKGKKRPLDLFVVRSARPRAFRLRTRGIEGVETRMVGRQPELERLQDATDATATDGRPRFVLVVGEAGVGKSRLLYEYRNWLELRDRFVRYFYAAATPDLQSTPYSLVRGLLTFRFEIADTDAIDVVQKKLLDGFVQFIGPEGREHAAVVGHLLGWGFEEQPAVLELAGDTARLRDRAGDAVAALLAGAAAQLPAIVVLEDLHWADEGSMALVESLATGAVDAPITALALARGELLERHPALAASHVARIDLRPLDDSSSRDLIVEILQRARDVPDDLVELAVRRSGGNPFFVEEIVTMLIDAGAIVTGDEVWEIDEARLDTLRVPTTVAEVIGLRLDRLEPDERAVLHAAAVVGAHFWDDAVAAALDTTADAIADTLATLARKELIHVEPTSSVADAVEFRFRHAITRDVTYGTIVRADRHRFHRAAARWHAQRFAAGAAGFEAVIARHLELGDEPHEAAHWYVAAAREAERRAAYGEAVEPGARALQLGDESTRLAAHVLSGRFAAVLGDPTAAQEHFDAAAALARTRDDANALVEALSERMRLALLIQGDLEQTQRWVEEGLAALSRVVDVKTRVGFLRQLGTIGIVSGDHELAARHLEQALPLARDAADPMELAFILNNLAHVRTEQARFDEALQLSEETKRLGESVGNRRVTMAAIAHVGLVHLRQGDPSAALARFAEAQELNRQVGDQEKLATVSNYLGICALELGTADEAAVHFHGALALAHQRGFLTEALRAVAGLARVADLRGEVAEGARLARVVLAHPASPWEARIVAQPLVHGHEAAGDGGDLDAEVVRLLAH